MLKQFIPGPLSSLPEKKIKQNEKKSIEKKYIKNEKIKQDCAWGVKDQRITINKDFNCI